MDLYNSSIKHMQHRVAPAGVKQSDLGYKPKSTVKLRPLGGAVRHRTREPTPEEAVNESATIPDHSPDRTFKVDPGLRDKELKIPLPTKKQLFYGGRD